MQQILVLGNYLSFGVVINGVFHRKEGIYSVWFKVTCASSLNFKIMLSLHMRHVFEAVVLDVCRW